MTSFVFPLSCSVNPFERQMSEPVSHKVTFSVSAPPIEESDKERDGANWLAVVFIFPTLFRTLSSRRASL